MFVVVFALLMGTYDIASKQRAKLYKAIEKEVQTYAKDTAQRIEGARCFVSVGYADFEACMFVR